MSDAEATVEEEAAGESAAAPEPEATETPAEQAEAAPAKGREETAKGGDKKKGKAKKKSGKGDEEPQLADGPSVAGHPRAARSIERAKGWGALVGLLAGFYFSLPTHTLADAGLRGLVAGVVLYVAVWAGSVFFWRRMVMVEIRAREQQLIAAARAAHARAASAAAAAEGSRGAGG